MSDVIRPNPQELTAYLLGEAGADEAERFDELSITDDEFAEGLEAAEMDLIDAYVNDELSAADREKFERIYRRSGDKSGRVAFARALQQYASSPSPTPAIVPAGGSDTFFKWPRHFQFGFAAAALLLAIAAGWLFISRSGQNVNETARVPDNPLHRVDVATSAINSENSQPVLSANNQREKEKEKEKAKETPKDEPRSAPRIVAAVLTPQMRSSSFPQRIEVPTGTDQFSARLELESGDFRSYRAVLREQSSSRVIWQSNALKPTGPSDARRLAVSVPARLFDSAIYAFTVSGVSVDGSAEIVGDYAFRVVR